MKWIKINEVNWPDEPMLVHAEELWAHTRRGFWLARFDVNEKRRLWVLYSHTFKEIHNQYEITGTALDGPPLQWAEICLKQ